MTKHWNCKLMFKEEEDGSDIDLLDSVNLSEQEPCIYQEGERMDIIIATDNSGLFGVGCHGWIIATRDE
jgi:hypothetical protein